MNKIFVVIICLSLLQGCAPSSQNDDRGVITVSILPQKYFVERIAGDDFNVNVLIPPGASPATYEPTPRQMESVANSLLYFRVGHIPFEKAWFEKLTSGADNLKVVDLSKGVELIRVSDSHHCGHDHGGGVDPHIWTSLRVVKHMANLILKELVQLEPLNKSEYEKNYNLFVKDLDDLDQEAKQAFANNEDRTFMIYHPAMSYFARDYGLRQIPIELEGKEPSPSHMKKVMSDARDLGISVVFVQKQFGTENAKAVAREIGGEVQSIDPLNEDWLKEMQKIIAVLKASLCH